jgi:transcriptional regulator with XRE-family HTH domain
MAIAENLKTLRLKRGLSQEQLEAASGITQTAISRYERGRNLPDVSSLLKLATGLRVPLEALAEGVNMKFDAMFQGFRVTIEAADTARASDNDRHDDIGAEAASALADMPLGEILHGAPDDAGASSDSPADMAAAIRALHRTVSELVSITGRIAAGHPAVVSRMGSPVRARTTQDGRRARAKHPAAAQTKRR